MAHIRRLLTPEQKRRQRAGELPAGEKPRGLWQATIRHPSGKKYSKSDPLKKVVQTWADDEEAKIRRGEWIDPHAGKVTLAEWREKWEKTRRVEIATQRRTDSWWRLYIEPKFGTWPIAAIQSWDVEAWVADLEKKGVGLPTVNGSLRLLGQMLRAAVKPHRLLTADPTADIVATPPAPHIDRILTRAEAAKLLEQFGDRDRLFVELLLYCGLRWQEAAGLRRFRVDLLRRRIQIVKVLPRKGAEKGPKTASGVRLVPLTDELVVKLSRAIPAPDDGWVFTSESGGRLWYEHWHVSVWTPALERAKLTDPQPTPHDLRHTFGSWLAEKGVPPNQIAALMGHKSLRSTERYIHATEARFDQARAALGAAVERREDIPERDSGIPE
jgi:integrase